MKIIAGISLGFLLALQQGCGPDQAESQTSSGDSLPLRTAYIRDSLATVDTLSLTFYLPVNSYAGITSVRPLKSDSNVLFVCAAAFTLLENDAIDGLFIDNGDARVKWVNHSLGGGIIIPNKDSGEKANIFGTEMGELLDSTFRDSILRMKYSFFQQIQLVRNGQALRFQKEFSLFQRRALCIWHGELVVVESNEACTMQKFANTLKSCGIQNALYVDMGSWDEGWYRNQYGELIGIGMMKNETDRQSNWFTFRMR